MDDERIREELGEEKYRELVTQSSDVLTVVAEDGTILYQSPGSEHVKGWPRQELLGSNVLEHVHPNDRKRVQEQFGNLAEETGPVSKTTEFRFRTPDDEWIWLEVTGSVPDSDSTVGGYIVSSRDVTDRKKAERERERQLNRFQRLQSVLSHDLRSPLNVAQGHCELARGREEGDSEHLEAIEQSLDRMEELIDTLLTLAAAGEDLADPEPVEIAAVAEEAWQQTVTGMGEASLVVETDLTVIADRSRLQQLFENLIGNAITHAGPETTVTVGHMPDHEGFYVADDGPGIPESEREAVFESGYSGTDEGTGFGLSIVREIVEAHGWAIEITESADGGARFEITDIDRSE